MTAGRELHPFAVCFQNKWAKDCSDLAFAAVDLRKSAQVEALAAAAGDFGRGIGELQAAIDQLFGVVDDQAVQKLYARCIRDDTDTASV